MGWSIELYNLAAKTIVTHSSSLHASKLLHDQVCIISDLSTVYRLYQALTMTEREIQYGT